VTRSVRILAALIPAALLAAAFVVRVPAGWVVIRSWRGGGTPALLGGGFAFRIPFVQNIERIPGEGLDARGVAEVPSREGATVGLPYTVRLRVPTQDLLRLSQEGGPAGAREALAGFVEDRLKEAASSTGTYDLASGTAGVALEARLRDALRQRFPSGAVEASLSTPLVPQEVRASFAREAIFAHRAETGLRLLLVGLDGADWDVIDPMIARGELPALARLKREGAWARLRSNVPTLSPLLWTTIATGKSPDRHGINDFLVTDPRSGRRVPINSTFRRVQAFWNILSAAGMPVDVIAWWATWPADAIDGHLISDRVAYSTFDLGSVSAGSGAVHPRAYAASVDRLRVREDAVTWRQVSRFLHVSETEFRAARAVAASRARPTEDQESINVFVRVLAATETYRRIAIDLLDDPANKPRLLAVYFEGVDEVNHRFAHCSPPRVPLCSDGDWARFRDAVVEFYRYQDGILEELMTHARGATTLVLSDHGFASGDGRPDDVKPFIEGKPGLWHDLTGIFAAHGPGIARGQLSSATLYDMMPTLLYLLGLPVPDDIPGKVLEKSITPEFLATHAMTHVPSYEGLGASGGHATATSGDRPAGQGEPLTGGAEDEMVAQLRSLGYVGGPAETGTGASPSPGAVSAGAAPAGAALPGTEGVPTLLYHTNLAAVHMSRRQFDQAEAELRQALAIEPNAPEAMNLFAALYELRGEPEKSLEILRGLVGSDPHYAPGRLVKMAGLFVSMGRPADGVAYFTGLGAGSDGRLEAARLVALGTTQAAAGRARAAESTLRAALALEPASLAGMQELFALADARGAAAELEPLLRAGLRREPRAGMFHNWLGLVLKRKGDRRGAEMEFRQALEVTPDLVGCMANLGGLYLEEGRAAEATAVLQGALDRDAHSVEVRANLIVALGLQREVAGVRAQADAAEKLGQKAPPIYNALAYALHVNGLDDEAQAAVRRSLALDPRQQDAQRLLQEIETGAPTVRSGNR
jgi:Flp pilus assembly protein TadD